jgi:ABC-type oligopeptide transport system ATPase subunit
MRVPPRDWREIFELPAHPYAPALISAIPICCAVRRSRRQGATFQIR